MPFLVATFYHFFDFPDFAAKKQPLMAELERLGIKGSLLIAPEGINGTLAGTEDAMKAFLASLEADIIKCKLEYKVSRCARQPFARAKVRIKKEVISLGEPVSPKHKIGHYVSPAEWNALIDDPETIVLDARNHYEVHLGTFARAINPGIRTFKALPAYVKKNMAGQQRRKIATFCTGGIRCEKFSSWLVGQGFEQVYQLKGGILKYLETVPEAESRWHGECYVFDERVAVGHGLVPSPTATMCQACGSPLTVEDRAHPLYKESKSCPHCEKN